MKFILLIITCFIFTSNVKSQNPSKTIWFKGDPLIHYKACFLHSFFDLKTEMSEEIIDPVLNLNYYDFSIFGIGDTIEGFKYDRTIHGFQKWEKTKVFHFRMKLKKVSKLPESIKLEKSFFLFQTKIGKYSDEFIDSLNEKGISISNRVLDSIDHVMEEMYKFQRTDSTNYIYLYSNKKLKSIQQFYIQSEKCTVKVSFRYQLKAYLLFKLKNRKISDYSKDEIIKIIKSMKYSTKNLKMQLWKI